MTFFIWQVFYFIDGYLQRGYILSNKLIKELFI